MTNISKPPWYSLAGAAVAGSMATISIYTPIANKERDQSVAIVTRQLQDTTSELQNMERDFRLGIDDLLGLCQATVPPGLNSSSVRFRLLKDACISKSVGEAGAKTLAASLQTQVAKLEELCHAPETPESAAIGERLNELGKYCGPSRSSKPGVVKATRDQKDQKVQPANSDPKAAFTCVVKETGLLPDLYLRDGLATTSRDTAAKSCRHLADSACPDTQRRCAWVAFNQLGVEQSGFVVRAN